VKSLTGRASKRDDLLDLEETIRRLKPFSRHYLGMRSIPVDHVVGTEGRAGDFDRRFSPRRRHVSERMRRVSEAFPDGAFRPSSCTNWERPISSSMVTIASRSLDGGASRTSMPR
jgi:hypothetical protein